MLEWLNPDRDQAVKKYEKIRCRLIEILAGRGCHEAEDLSDEVIDRVVAKIDDVTKNYEGDPAYYFYGVAKKVLLEYWKPKPLPDPPSRFGRLFPTMTTSCDLHCSKNVWLFCRGTTAI